MGKLFKRGKKWGISYIDPQGCQIRKMVSTYKESAQRVLKKIEIEIIEGRYLDKKERKNIRFEDFADQYFDIYVKLENKNIINQKNLLKIPVARFRGRYLSQISTMDVRRYLAERAEKVKPASVNRELSLLKSMFNRAIEWGVFDKNPTTGIKKMPENNSRCRWLTVKEQKKLLSHCHGATRVLVLVALKTGMRWREIVNLKWQQSPKSNYVDFINNVIVVDESLSKSGKSRYIPLADSVKSALNTLPKHSESEYMFFNPDTEKPLGSIKTSFKTALKNAVITNFKFHDLRHTFASNLAMNGVDLYTIKELLGHSSLKMTERYAHLQPAKLKAAIDKLEKSNVLLSNIEYNDGSKNSTFLAHRENDGNSRIGALRQPVENKSVK